MSITPPSFLYRGPTDDAEDTELKRGAEDLSGEWPEVAREMRGRFERWRAEMDAAEARGPFRDY